MRLYPSVAIGALRLCSFRRATCNLVFRETQEICVIHSPRHSPSQFLPSQRYFSFMGNSGSTEAEMSSAKDFVEQKLQSRKVVVFSKSYCPFCRKAKQALAPYKLSDEVYEIIEIEDRPDCDSIQDYLKKLTGARSVPRVFIGGKCIGGGDETVALERQGQLKVRLTEAGAM